MVVAVYTPWTYLLYAFLNSHKKIFGNSRGGGQPPASSQSFPKPPRGTGYDDFFFPAPCSWQTSSHCSETIQLKTVWKWKFWMRPRRTNGLAACYQHRTLATEKLIWTSVCRLLQRPSMRTNGFCVTRMFP